MSFYKENGIYKSSLLDGVHHGFSSRHGGISTLPHTSSLNLAYGRGDDAEIVKRNTDIFARAVCGFENAGQKVISVPQVHGCEVRYVDESDCGIGVYSDAVFSCDGYITNKKYVPIMVKIADCVPILLWDGENIISAVHAGWRGTVKNIVGEAVLKMQSLGADVKNIKAAVGACIHKCCYEVGLDLYETAESLRGDEFCRRYITYNEQGKLFCDLPGMNRELLLCAGIDDANIDICPHCTACEPEEFFSHRATNGIRGTMGAMICLC